MWSCHEQRKPCSVEDPEGFWGPRRRRLSDTPKHGGGTLQGTQTSLVAAALMAQLKAKRFVVSVGIEREGERPKLFSRQHFGMWWTTDADAQMQIFFNLFFPNWPLLHDHLDRVSSVRNRNVKAWPHQARFAMRIRVAPSHFNVCGHTSANSHLYCRAQKKRRDFASRSVWPRLRWS